MMSFGEAYMAGRVDVDAGLADLFSLAMRITLIFAEPRNGIARPCPPRRRRVLDASASEASKQPLIPPAYVYWEACTAAAAR